MGKLKITYRTEEWRPVFIKHFKTIYEISNYGRFRNIETGHIYKPFKNKKGYLSYSFYIRQKHEGSKNVRKLAHRLVAKAFIPNPKKRKQINHKDGNKENNYVNNLEWCTNMYNSRHATNNNLRRSKLSPLEVYEICELLLDTKNTYEAIAKKYNVATETIRSINVRNTWTRISRKYDFPPRKVPLTKRQVHKVCRMLEKGIDDEIIANEIGCTKFVIRRIKYRKNFKYISDKYKF